MNAYEETRFREVVLPSNGCLGYSKIVEVRPLVVAEEELITTFLASRDFSVDELSLQLFKSGCVKGISDFRKLSLGDRDFLFVWLRVNSFGADYECIVRCPDCRKEQNRVVDLSTLKAKGLEDFVEPEEIDLGENGKAQLKVIRLEDTIERREFLKQFKEFKEYSVGYAQGIVNEQSLYERVKWLRDLPVMKFKKIKEWYAKKALHGIEDIFEFKCSELDCGWTGKVLLPLGVGDLFFP